MKHIYDIIYEEKQLQKKMKSCKTDEEFFQYAKKLKKLQEEKKETYIMLITGKEKEWEILLGY